MSPDPWFSQWNYRVLQVIFDVIPRSPTTIDTFDYLIENPLVSTWLPAAFFYVFWTRRDEQQARRRCFLFKTVVAFAIAVFITLIIRPWIHWPAPLLNPRFQPLFPQYLWGSGSKNCFPSHSTLTYFMVALGFWPMNRRLSVALSILVLLCVSLPRVYVGGHYLIDVVSSCVLGILVLIMVWRWRIPRGVNRWLTEDSAKVSARDWLLFLWTFELGEGFRGTEFLLEAARQIVHWP